MTDIDATNTEIPDWVERLCTLVRFTREPKATIAGLFLNAAPDLSDRKRFHLLVSNRLRGEPPLIDAWESFSADNRGTPCAYLTGTEVGMYDNGYSDVVRHEDRADACADYLLRRASSIAGIQR